MEVRQESIDNPEPESRKDVEVRFAGFGDEFSVPTESIFKRARCRCAHRDDPASGPLSSIQSVGRFRSDNVLFWFQMMLCWIRSSDRKKRPDPHVKRQFAKLNTTFLK